MSCAGERCPEYVAETNQCFRRVEKEYKLSQMKPSTTIQAPPQTPIVEGMKSDNPFPELKVGGFVPSIAGKISSPIAVREVGSDATPLAEFGLTDGASGVKVTVWRPGSQLDNFNVGSWITLTAMSVKEYKGEIQLNTTRGSKISR